MERLESALDLFFKYCGRYPRIEMEPIGFRHDLTEAGRFYLRPSRKGIPLGHETTKLSYPYIDVMRADVVPWFRFQSPSGKAPLTHLNEQFWTEMQRTILKGRRFYVRLCRDAKLLPRHYNIQLPEKQDFPVEFATWPAIPAGLVLNPEGECPRGYLHWSAFVPKGTPEHDAIAAALTLGEMARLVPKPNADTIAALQDDVRRKVAFVRV